MKRLVTLAFGLIVLVTGLLLGAGVFRYQKPISASRPPPEPTQATRSRISTAYGNLPLSFEKNAGQTDPQVRFLARSRGSTVFITTTGATFSLAAPAERREPRHGLAFHTEASSRREAASFSMKVAGARAAAEPSGLQELPGKANYFIGNDPSRWHTNIPTFAQVKVPSVYPGIDLVWYGKQGQLEYDFVVAPGADPEVIRVAFEGVDGLRVDGEGNLLLTVAGREVIHRRPLVYEEENGKRRELGAAYVVHGKDEVSFRVEGRDPKRALVIDPSIAYSTYLGGSSGDDARSIAVDSQGHAYVLGSTSSLDFPVTVNNRLPPDQDKKINSGMGGDAFVVKLNQAGNALIYATYLGGSSSDSGSLLGNGIAVDSSGSAYVCGTTESTDFPPVNSLPKSTGVNSGQGTDAFVAKLNVFGNSLAYSTYLGGSKYERCDGLAIDSSGSAYVTGGTTSNDFPLKTALQCVSDSGRKQNCGNSPQGDAFVAKLQADGAQLVYSTYLGGSQGQEGEGIAVDGDGNAYIAGATDSLDFPVDASALQKQYEGGNGDAFIAELNASGNALLHATYLGGAGYEQANGIALDGSGNIYVTGYTNSYNFVDASPRLQSRTDDDAFVVKLGNDWASILYSIYLGGSSEDLSWGIAVDGSGNAYVVGETDSADFPTAGTAGAFQTTRKTPDGVRTAFLTRLTNAGVAAYSTYFGGSRLSTAYAVAADESGYAYVAGNTNATDFPLAGADGTLQSHNGGEVDTFIAKIPTTVAITGINPVSGLSGQTTEVTIYGHNFSSSPTPTVTFGGANVTPSTVNGEGTELTVTAPSHADGTVQLTVTNPDQQAASWPGGFTYLTEFGAPSVTSISPSTGPTSGGTTVTITGSNFQSGATVAFGDKSATQVTVSSTTSITADTPEHDPGVVNVVVTNPDQQNCSAGNFTYVTPLTITSLTPVEGPDSGGSTVTVIGAGILEGATVTFGDVASSSVTFVDSTRLTVKAPAHAVGKVVVTVTNPSPNNQTYTLPDGFLYYKTTGGCSSGASPASAWSLVVLVGVAAGRWRRGLRRQ